MPDSKITALTSISTSTDPANDPLVIVDVSDTSMAATGTTKKVTLNQLLGASGTATLASATITGDLTVDTNVLKVDTTNNRVGINNASPAAGFSLDVAGGIRANSFFQSTDGTNTGIFGTNVLAGGVIGICSGTNVPLVFGVNSTEQMRLNATGLGLGVSPITALSFPIGTNKVVGQSATSSHAAGNVGSLKFGIADGGGDYSGIQIFNTHDGTYSSQDIRFFTGQGGVSTSTERMRITPSGQVGIGVAPYASWPSTSRALQLGASSAIEGRTNDGSRSAVYTNAVWNGTNLIYQNTAAASYYLQSSGIHSWHNAASGTAGNAISFTQAMTLDSGGRLLVGKTSGVNNIETVGAGVDGRGTVTGVSTVATTIYTIKQSATAAMCVVFGDDGSNGFCDIVLFLATVAPKVVSSQTLYGSPAARTYSASTTNLQLALASGTLSIRTAALSTLNT